MRNMIGVYLISLALIIALSGCVSQPENASNPPQPTIPTQLPTASPSPTPQISATVAAPEISPTPTTEELQEEQGNGCEGRKIIFNYPPVNLEKTELLVPLGLMSGNHVTPVDHQYFQNFDNQKADIEVYSPGKGKVIGMQHMSGSYYDSQLGRDVEWHDFRLEIQHTCTISSTYIHIDVLSDKLAAFAPEKGKYASVKVPVEAGEIIGYYQSNVDYNLVDLEVNLTGFVVPEHYSEAWKMHVPDTLAYFDEEVREKMIEISLREKEPISGKFDHDIDGKLIGNWFEAGTKGYGGTDENRYWIGHLSISPDYLDYDHFIVSLADYDGTEAQFGVKGNAPYPSEVGVETGVVKYELVSYEYYDKNGNRWDRRSLVKGLKAKNNEEVQGAVLLQLTEKRKLKVEIFPGKTGDQVSGFTAGAKIYER